MTLEPETRQSHVRARLEQGGDRLRRSGAEIARQNTVDPTRRMRCPPAAPRQYIDELRGKVQLHYRAERLHAVVRFPLPSATEQLTGEELA